MSDKCGNCDCADRSQCVKKGNSYDVVVADLADYDEKSHFGMVEGDAYENDGKCKCGTSCSCTDCKCDK